MKEARVIFHVYNNSLSAGKHPLLIREATKVFQFEDFLKFQQLLSAHKKTIMEEQEKENKHTILVISHQIIVQDWSD